MTSPIQLTYTGVGIVVFARQLCLPLPAVALLIVSGALAGHNHMNPALIVLVSMVCCVAADGVWFWLGRHWGSRVVRMVCRLTSDPRGSFARANRIFDRWGLRVLLVAKFIPLVDGVSPPLAGAEGTSVRRFLLYDGAGAFLWSSAYVLLGVLFANQLDRVIDETQRFATVFGILVGVPLVVYAVWRAFLLIRMMRYLRLHRMTPATLYRKLTAGEKIAIIDLLAFEEGDDHAPGIPGAARIDPVRLRLTPKITVPDDMSIVLYCSSRDQFVSARVAVTLRRRGAKRVWILDGGLKGWQDQGFSVTTELSTPQQVAARLGIDLPPPRLRGTPAIPAPGI
jgi:membrane protein DedA with SNARE-associated domain/rhodanese-related sulfurtransferase